VWRVLLVVIASAVCRAHPCAAQASVPQFRGDFGLNSGTLAPEGAYYGGLYNYYAADYIITSSGTQLSRLVPTVNVLALFGTYSFAWKVLGGRMSSTMAVPWADVALETPNLQRNTSWGLSDVYLQPVRLGWSKPSADFVAGLGVYMPSGRFQNGATNNTGFGMWSTELSAGSTVYLGPKKVSSGSVQLSYQIQSHVKDSDKRAGQVLTLEGGFGHKVLENTGDFGIVYYAQWKVTRDQNYNLPQPFDAKDRIFGFGPELTVPFPIKQNYGIATLRYYWEAGNRVATQGKSLFLMFNVFMPPKHH
jgi:hypothetical protein